MEYKDKLLGTIPDVLLAELTDKNIGWVWRRRVKLGMPSYKSLFGCLPRFDYNIEVFEKIDSNIKAYWLGYYFADGCV